MNQDPISQPNLIDAHTHVHFSAFEDDYKETIQRAHDKKIWLITVGTQVDTSAKAVEVANEYEAGVYASIGLHPAHTSQSFLDKNELGGGNSAKEFTTRGEVFSEENYLALANNKRTVAIGECGLDYYRLEGDAKELKQKQATAFSAQIELANKVQKPLMIHCRPSRGTDDAYQDVLDILAQHELRTPLISHFYVGSLEMTKKMLALGFYFTFGGVITFSNAREYDPSIRLIPLERIMTETDAPYVAPEPFRGKRNEPSYVDEVAKKLAEIKNTTLDKVASSTVTTAKQIFKI